MTIFFYLLAFIVGFIVRSLLNTCPPVVVHEDTSGNVHLLYTSTETFKTYELTFNIKTDLDGNS